MSRTRLLPTALLAAVATGLGTLVAAPAQAAPAPLEDFATYQPQTRCRPRARPGTVVLGTWIVATYGGAFGGISRPCSAATSEHQEGRAFDWTLDATRRADRLRAKALLADVFATDRRDNPDARARRMGIMYVIWNDRMYAAWNTFAPVAYLSSGCESPKTCSATLRHRDHLHVSLTRAAGRGATSWYVGRLP